MLKSNHRNGSLEASHCFFYFIALFFSHNALLTKKRTENAKVKSQSLMFLLLHFQCVIYVNT